MNEHYERSEHRTDATSFDSVQSGNKKWWTNHTMSYDWEAAIDAEAYSRRWFEEVDRRFVESAKIYSQLNSPFDRFIPFEQLKGKSVLEVSCEACGQIADALPLPRRIRAITKLFVSEAWLKRKQAQRGNFLVLKASKPCK